MILKVRPLGPFVDSKGNLFFKVAHGETISCNCIAGPYADRIVQLFRNSISEAYARGYATAQFDLDWQQD